MKKGKVFRILKLISSIVAILGVMIFPGKNAYVYAATNVEKALRASGITPNENISEISIKLNGVLFTVVKILGSSCIVALLIWGGVTLASSRQNPQQRIAGYLRLSLVIVVAYAMFKLLI